MELNLILSDAYDQAIPLESTLANILVGCLRGEEKNRKHLYLSYYPYVMGIMTRYIRNNSDMEELANDCFIKIFKNLHKFSITDDVQVVKKDFKSWIAKISSRTAIDFLRIAKNKNLSEELSDDLVVSHLNVTDNLHVADILKLMDGLSTLQRIIFNMYEIDGFSHQEIAATLHIGEKHSSVYLSRAKNQLRTLYLKELKLKGTYHE